ncbi:AraC family transcriptional regulator, partial [Candidatus Entotheonella serta]
MSKEQITDLIKRRLPEAGLINTALKGVQLFRVTKAMPCMPAVY